MALLKTITGWPRPLRNRISSGDPTADKRRRASSANNEALLRVGSASLGDEVGGPCSYRVDVESEALNEASVIMGMGQKQAVRDQ
jgi:hypothetical protein